MSLTPEMLEPSIGNQEASSEPNTEGNQGLDAIEVTTGLEAEPSEQPEETSTGEATLQAEEQPSDVPAQKQPYTPEELVSLLTSEQDVDTDRLSPEGKVLMKSFQTGYNKKFEKLSEKQKELDAKLNQQKPQGQETSTREQYYQNFLQNPDKVVHEINQAISELEVDPYNDENRKNIAALRQMKDDFFLRKTTESERNVKINEIQAQARAEIYEAIPDFDKKVPALNEFAEMIGFNLDELSFLTNPVNTGKFASKLTKALNKAYDIINASKTVEKKIDKTPPLVLGKAGVPKSTDKKIDIGSLSQEEFEKEWSKNYKT